MLCGLPTKSLSSYAKNRYACRWTTATFYIEKYRRLLTQMLAT